MHTLKEVNEGLAQSGIPVVLSMESAAMVTEKIGRDDFVSALKRSIAGDARSRGFIEVNLSRLGLLGESSANEDLPSRDGHETQPSDAPQNGEPNEQHREYLSYHVYGTDALCFNVDQTKNGFHTIRIDAAKAADGKRKKWNEKISIQLTPAEILVVMGVLMKVRDRCEFKAHGPAKDKGFSMEVQNENVFCRVFAKDKPVVNVPIVYSDRAHVVSLFYRQMRKSYPWLDCFGVSTLVRIC